ncbi:S-adenosylmethionine decarboxylase [Candidatus Woesearchaeota archaeon]|nr:S-adenosylmethionine decarboxylase [Candidatus Woesearchaeota archaeon]
MEQRYANRISYQVVDVYGEVDNLPDDGLVSRVISGLVDELGMRRVGSLKVTNTSRSKTYIQVIRESHIAAIFTSNCFAVISICSCRYFDESATVSYLKSRLRLKNSGFFSYKN